MELSQTESARTLVRSSRLFGMHTQFEGGSILTRRTLLSLAPAVSPLGLALSSAAEVRKQMKITGIETDLLRLPQTEFTGDAIHDFGSASGGVVLRVLTSAGITGWGYSNFGMIEGGPRVVQTILESEVKSVLVGQDPAFPKKIQADLWRALEYQGVQGVTQFAMSVVDIAIWDILGKAAGLPVYKMLGAVRDRMPVYAMCGWYRRMTATIRSTNARLTKHWKPDIAPSR